MELIGNVSSPDPRRQSAKYSSGRMQTGELKI
jgi:hypothetical protein